MTLDYIKEHFSIGELLVLGYYAFGNIGNSTKYYEADIKLLNINEGNNPGISFYCTETRCSDGQVTELNMQSNISASNIVKLTSRLLINI